jgi:hypothetical protein
LSPWYVGHALASGPSLVAVSNDESEGEVDGEVDGEVGRETGAEGLFPVDESEPPELQAAARASAVPIAASSRSGGGACRVTTGLRMPAILRCRVGSGTP